MKTFAFILSLSMLAAIPLQRLDSLIADFEGSSYLGWETTGNAFGPAPAQGTLPNQIAVRGFRGRGLVNSYLGGDASTGSLTSPPFIVQRKWINFLIGGGRHPGKTAVNLRIDGRIVRTASGRDSELLLWTGWNVAEFEGRTARIQIVDEAIGGWGHINVDHIIQSDAEPVNEDDRDGALQRAKESIAEAAKRAGSDPARPVFHFRAPGNWMNDPNGPLYYKGWYHMFYQHNPYGDQWGNMHWGHARSRDMVRWEHLPIALWPSLSKGEEHVFSGCAAVNGQGIPMLFYTSIGHPIPEMWAATPEDTHLIKWKKHPRNPLLTANSQGTKFDDWRDPFIFHAAGKTFLVHGGNLNQAKGGQAVVSLYRARNSALTDWEYRGILFRHPDPRVVNIECPNFFPLGEKWVLITSPHRACDYFVGDFDPETGRFTVEKQGMVDFSDQYYAPNGLRDPKGRRIVWGWIRGFPDGRGWNGCLSLPRLLTLGPDSTLRQNPIPELKKLRGKQTVLRSLDVEGSAPIPVTGAQLEMEIKLEMRGARACGIRLRRSGDGARSIPIRLTSGVLEVAGAAVPIRTDGPVRLRIFLDRSLLEVFVNDGENCVTRVINAPDSDLGIELFSESGNTRFERASLWTMNPAW